MGLRSVISLNSLGFPSYTPTLHIPVDYSSAMDLFCEVFLDIAQDLVPVDTGALMNSIDVDYSEDWVAVCVATMFYAQYVEYGTYKMSAQPFFEPAIQAALDEALPEFQTLYEEALEEEQEMLEEQIRLSGESMSEILGFGGMAGIVLLLFLIAAFTIVKEFFSEIFLDRGSSRNGGASLIGTLINVEVTDDFF